MDSRLTAFNRKTYPILEKKYSVRLIFPFYFYLDSKKQLWKNNGVKLIIKEISTEKNGFRIEFTAFDQIQMPYL